MTGVNFLRKGDVTVIVNYRLENIQSWSSDSGTVELSTDKINTLIAKSETGKSVIVKMLKEMAFPNNWDYTLTSLIRRGCKFGRVAFGLTDGCICVYDIYINGDRIHTLLTPKEDGSGYSKKQWVNLSEIPEEMEKKMGFILDRESKTIINVVDKHSPLPFSNSDLKCNARILSVITENPQLENALETLGAWRDRLEVAARETKILADKAYGKYSIIPVQDTLSLQTKLNNEKKILKVVELVEPLKQETESLSLFLNSKPKEMKNLELDNEFELLSHLTSVNKEITILENLINNKPKVMKPLNIDNEIAILTKIQTIDNECESLNSLIQNAPKVISPIHEEFETALNIIDKCNNLINSLNELEDLKNNKPSVMEDLRFIENIIETLTHINLDYDGMCELCTKYTKSRELNTKLTQVIKKCEEVLKVCPLCGKSF